jgi:hypothetical protein
LAALWDWLSNAQGWVTAAGKPPTCDGHIDALVCAMVAAAMGGIAFSGLRLVNPILGDALAREYCKLPADELPRARPNPYLLGPSPYYLLVSDGNASVFKSSS